MRPGGEAARQAQVRKNQDVTVVRRVEADEWEVVREIRLRGLRDAPDFFWSTYEDEVDQTPEWWREFVDAGAWFVAWDSGRPVGVVAAIRDGSLGATTRQLISMWVAPEARERRVAERLVNEVKEWAAQEGADRLLLDVTQGNDRARRLYERCAFRVTGRTTAHPRDSGLRELEMELRLAPGRGPGDRA